MTIKKLYTTIRIFFISVTSYNSNKLLKENITKLKNRMVSVIKLIKNIKCTAVLFDWWYPSNIISLCPLQLNHRLNDGQARKPFISII